VVSTPAWRCSCALRTRRWAHSRPNRRVGPMPTPGPMALAGGNGRVVVSGRPFDRQRDARGKRAVVDSGTPRRRAEGTPQPCLRVTGAISSAVHPPCRSDCVVRTLKLGPVRPAITARFRHRFSFTRGRSLVRSQPGPLRDGAGQVRFSMILAGLRSHPKGRKSALFRYLAADDRRTMGLDLPFRAGR
jgi:hypothetical protein